MIQMSINRINYLLFAVLFTTLTSLMNFPLALILTEFVYLFYKFQSYKIGPNSAV